VIKMKPETRQKLDKAILVADKAALTIGGLAWLAEGFAEGYTGNDNLGALDYTAFAATAAALPLRVKAHEITYSYPPESEMSSIGPSMVSDGINVAGIGVGALTLHLVGKFIGGIARSYM